MNEITSKTFNINNYYNNEVEQEEINKAVEELRAKIQELRSTDLRMQKIQEKTAKETISTTTTQTPFTKTTEKTSQIGPSMLVVHTDQIITSKDNSGEIQHYAVSFISKNGEKIEVKKYPIDVEKYGEIKNIIISDGKKCPSGERA